MNLVLSSKHSFDDSDVTEVWNNIGDYVSVDEAADAVEKAVSEVLEVCGAHRDRVAYGWSGGKDSIALQVVMERAGIRRPLLGIVGKLEWRHHVQWMAAHKPDGLVVLSNDELDYAWMATPEAQQFIFPRDAKAGYFWTMKGTRRAQRLYQEQYDPLVQCYGRRSQDGNFIGQAAYGIHQAAGVTQYCPLRDWPHELVLAVVHYFSDHGLPPVYDHPHGWTAGTGPWPGRRVGTIEESWAETFGIQPDVVHEAASAGVPGAVKFLRERSE